MERLDTRYLSTLVIKAQMGGSNAFAELYTATYQTIFNYAYELLEDEALSKQAMKATYVKALKELSKLTEPELLLSWLYHIDFEICEEIKNTEDDSLVINQKSYRVMQLSKNLPMTEAQVLIMKYYQHYSQREICKLLGLDSYVVKETMHSGEKHLKHLLGDSSDVK